MWMLSGSFPVEVSQAHPGKEDHRAGPLEGLSGLGLPWNPPLKAKQLAIQNEVWSPFD